MEKIPYICDKEAVLETIRDPMVALIDGRYYLTGTQPPYWSGPNAGVRLWSSDDLRKWTDHGLMISRENIPEKYWCRDRFWAPEIFDGEDGYYYITFNCRNDSEKYRSELLSGIARAESPTGPYTIMSLDEPITSMLPDGTNDASMFRDDDGSVYFTCNNTPRRIVLFRFDPISCTLSDMKEVVTVGGEGEWDSAGVEGPCIVKRHGLYFLWYSSWTRGYDAGVAVSDSLYGTWKKCSANPVLSSCEMWVNAGHNNVFRGRDGKDYITFHAAWRGEEGGKERFFIRPVEYKPDGTVIISN